MPDVAQDLRAAARSVLAAREYRIAVARQLRQGTGHVEGLRRARRSEANAARALLAAVNAPRPVSVLGEVGAAGHEQIGNITGALTIDTTSPLPGDLFGARVRVEVVGWPEGDPRHEAGSLNESRPDDVPVEVDPPPCGPGDRRPVLYEALTAVVADIGPIGDESSRRAASLMLIQHLRQAGGLDELLRQQTFHEGWCKGFGDGRATTPGGGEDGRG